MAVLVLNKVDLVSGETLLQLCAALNDAYAFAETFMVSALNGKGVDDFYDYLAAHLPESPWYYPEEQMSDLPLKLLAAEIVREKLFLYLRQEVPYALTVEPELWERRADNSVRAEMTIYVERDSQKQIVLGRGGAMIKKIGQAARRELEELLEDRIHLFLFVKVRENWGPDERRREIDPIPEMRNFRLWKNRSVDRLPSLAERSKTRSLRYQSTEKSIGIQ